VTLLSLGDRRLGEEFTLNGFYSGFANGTNLYTMP
jgi:hypothetical protein